MSLLLRCPHIVDGVGASFTEHGVLIEGERIARVAPMAEFEGYAGEAMRLDDTTLLPGIIDCHVHLCFGAEPNPGEATERMRPGAIAVRALANAQQSLRGGITSVRDCGGKDYLEFAARDACNRGHFQGPTIRAAGRMICMTGGHGNRFGRVADGIDEVVKAVREQIHAGSDLVKIMATGGVMTPGVDPEDAHYSAEEMAAGIAEGHRFHKPCASHAQGTEGILNAVRGGVDSIEHGIFISEKCIEEMLERRTYLVPTLSALKNILDASDPGIPDYVLEKAARISETHQRSIRMFYEAGGLIAMGTDAGTPFNHHGDNAQELRYMVEVGIAPMDAIRISTSNAADLMRLETTGRIEEGAMADLLVVAGNPLEDIEAIADRANHRLVIKRGERVHAAPGEPAATVASLAAAQ
ncbi:MAG: amidohydrolase family protein [Gammaproteobacteria bacterium]|nr:amidohydrolase family protein [Gammaproteobacteria bacterium]NIM71909.1 amidohydrolase family protein [Gammaproteobacteria bacterium]NIN38031.1 amidohydrolase family protein [Gammaproteobacteria bacterium]NIO23665.1 amidohydrolase family protein [Gammaproteobacteria bacterium]NIO64281.1 amidohydrolase family protein [Gammaproteobacteria bacterium]